MPADERTVVFQLPSVVSGQLACFQGTVAGRSWKLSAGTFVVGRKEGCDLHLPAEPGVSKVHCKIVAEGDRYQLIDAESRNGTIVNGRPVQTAVLKDGDEIQICGCKLRFTQTGGGGSGGLGAGGGGGTYRNPPPPAATQDEITDRSFAAPRSEAGFTPVGGTPAPPADYPVPPSDLAGPTVAAPVPGTRPGVGESPMTAPWPPPTDSDSMVLGELPAHELTDVQGGMPEIIEVRGSAFPAFLAGLFVVLIGGGGAYAALLFLNDGALPAPGVSTPDDALPLEDAAPLDDGSPAPGGAATGEGTPDPEAATDGAKDPPGPGAAVGAPSGSAAVDADDDDEEDEEAAEVDEAEPEPAAAPAARARGARTKPPRKKPSPAQKPPPAEDKPAATAAPAATPAPEAEDGEEEAADEEEAPAGPAAKFYDAKPLKPERTAIRVPAGGRVKAVDVEDGATVQSGDVLARMEGAGSSPADIETKRESIRALKSIVENSGDPAASKLLEEEEAALASMLASASQVTLKAPAAGVLSGFKVRAGETLRSRLVVGFVEEVLEPSVTVDVPPDVAKVVKPGQTVEIRTPKGSQEGTVRGKPKKKGKLFQVVVTVNGVLPSDVDGVKLP